MASTSNVAGALGAIEARVTDNWTTTRIVFDNKDPEQPWPPMSPTGPMGEAGKPLPWVFVEIVDIPVEPITFGEPGNRLVMDQGIIKMHVMVPKGSGLTDGREKATALGEIFRQKTFYTDDPTAKIISRDPTVGREGMSSETGNTVSVTCSVAFEFYHRA